MLCLTPQLSEHLPSRTGAVTDPVPGGGQGVRPPPPSRVIPSRPVLETFFQTLIVVLVLQQREVTVPRACRQ